MSRLRSSVRAKLLEPVEGAEPLVEMLRSEDGQEPLAVYVYGSTLSAITRSSTSIYDLFVVVDELTRFHRGRLQSTLNRFYPPNTYYRVLKRGDQPLRCKMCVVSAEQLRIQTSPRALDLYHIGRFSKRMALLWSRDEAARERVVDCSVEALRTIAPLARARLGESFTTERFATELLGLSYLSETRVSEATKVAKLLESERAYYLEAFDALLEEENVRREANGWRQDAPSKAAVRRTANLLAKSRRRARVRWSKNILTFDNWLDYLLDKLERHHGVKLELTDRERRWPLIFAWGKYRELRRKGIVK